MTRCAICWPTPACSQGEPLAIAGPARGPHLARAPAPPMPPSRSRANWSSECMRCSDAFIRGLPKAELHMHLEGSIEPELLLELAARNGVRLRWRRPKRCAPPIDFSDLQAFLDLYYEGCRVLVHERDFYDITRAYLRRAHADAVVRAEVFIGPQGFTERGVPIAA